MVLEDLLKTVNLPDQAFDPNGDWENSYVLWWIPFASDPRVPVTYTHKGPYRRPMGALKLRRERVGDGAAKLEVKLLASTLDGFHNRVQATIICAADSLSTPREWSQVSEMLDRNLDLVRGMRILSTGRFSGRRVARVVEGKRHAISVDRPLTGAWCLFDALQRLPVDAMAPLRFDMLEEMDLHKPEQTLSPLGSADFEFASGSARLRGFRQTGRGILPYEYWLDDKQRLVLAVSGLRAYVFSVDAPQVRMLK
jgi:hypothetical protein